MDRSTRIAHHTFTVFVGMILGGVLRYGFKISMARMLDVRGYGLLSSVEPFIILTASATLTGFAVALARYISTEAADKNIQKIETYISTALFYLVPLGILVTVILFVFSGVIAESLFHEPELTLLIRIVVAIIPVEALWLVIDGIFLGYQESPCYTYTLLLYNAVIFVVAILLVHRGWNTEGAVVALVMGDICGLSAAYGIYLWKFKGTPSLIARRPSLALFKKLIGFAIPKTITSISVMILMSFDIFCVTYFLGVSYTGLYNAAIPIARIILTVSSSIGIPLLPAISEDAARSSRHIASYMHTALIQISVVTIPFIIVCTVYAEEIIVFFFGPAYQEAHAALIILSVAMFFMAYCSVFSVLFQGMGTPQIPMKIVLGGLVCNMLLNVWLIPRWGIEGAAYATLLSMGVIFFSLSVKARAYTPFSSLQEPLIKIGLLSIAMTGLFMIMNEQFLIEIMGGMLGFAAGIQILKIIDIRTFFHS
jgi:O-antigen/teichoic acid export membrane protein